MTQPVGAPRTQAPDSTRVHSNVDELYRISLGHESMTTWRADMTTAWTSDTYNGVVRLLAYATVDGKRGAFVRVPSRKATIIILTNDPDADARGMADRILDRMLGRGS